MARVVALHPRLPWRRFPGLAWDLIQRRPRSFLADCRAMLEQLPTSWEGDENIPATGPLCIVANHFQRADLWIGWSGALLTVAVAERRSGQVPRWLVLGGLPIGPTRRHFSFPGAAWAFGRVADVWGLVPTTGFPDARQRSQSLRRLIELLQQGNAIGVFPEGASGIADRII